MSCVSCWPANLTSCCIRCLIIPNVFKTSPCSLAGWWQLHVKCWWWRVFKRSSILRPCPGSAPSDRDHPTVIKRRFTSVLIVSALSPAFVWTWKEFTGVRVSHCLGCKWLGFEVNIVCDGYKAVNCVCVCVSCGNHVGVNLGQPQVMATLWSCFMIIRTCDFVNNV